MRVWTALDRRISDRAILVVGWLWFLVYAFPGFMSFDSAWQLAQARHIVPMNEWHPPMMAFVWRWIDDIWAGPFPMLVLQSTLFLLGTRSLLRRVMSPRAAAIVAVLLLVVPPNIVVMAVIWKDSQMAAFLVAGIACLFSTQRRWRVAGYGLLLLATAFRYNAAAATLPIVVALFGFGGAARGWRRVVPAVVAWLAITVVAFTANALLVEEHQHVWQVGSAPVDIAGIIHYANGVDNDELLRETEGVPWHGDTTKLRIRMHRAYHPWTNFYQLMNEPNQIFDQPTTDAQLAAMSAAWKRLVVAHPLAFVRHRFAEFKFQLKAARGVWSELFNDIYDTRLNHRAVHSKLQQAWIDVLKKLDGTLVYRASLYFFLSLALLRIALHDRLTGIVVTSGLCYELGLLAVAPAIDYRYSHWMIACCLLACVLIFATRLRFGRDRRVESAA